jgi:hypothetical protein
MPDLIFDLPVLDLAKLCVAVTVGATWLGILVAKPLLRLFVGGEANLNGAISYVTSVFSLFYGLLVGLLAVAAYQNSEEVERGAFAEAAGIATLYDGLDSYPEPFRSEVQAMLRDYVLYVVYKGWPAHADGAILNGGANRVSAIRQRLAGFEPETGAQEIVHREMFGAFQGFTLARQARLAGVLTRIPDVLWYAVAAGAAVNIVLLVMLRIRPLPHLVLGGLASFFLGVMLLVVLALDDPLRGETGLKPEALRLLWQSRLAFDEPMV